MKYPKRSQYKYAKKTKYRIRNWPICTEALRRRRDLTIWFDVDAIEKWKADGAGKRPCVAMQSQITTDSDILTLGEMWQNDSSN
jgi:hypothetical protein